MHKRAIGTAVAVMAAAIGAGTASASAAPETKLPDYTLYCDTATVLPSELVVVPPANIWIQSGDLAGHYVILSESHYFFPGELRQRPMTYEDLQVALPPKTFGAKDGLEGKALSCDFVSYWEGMGMSVIGPVTLAKVSG
jgi:hypothetical protein